MTREEMEAIAIPSLTDEQWTKAKELAIGWCTGAMGSDRLMPQLMVYYSKDESADGVLKLSPWGLDIFAIAQDFNDSEQKNNVWRSIAARMVKAHKIPVAILMSSEAWQTQRPITDTRPLVQPRHDPARREIVHATGIRVVGADGKTLRPTGWHWHQKVTRDGQNKMVADGEPITVEGESSPPAPILGRLLRQFAMFAAKLEPMPEKDDMSYPSAQEMADAILREHYKRN